MQTGVERVISNGKLPTELLLQIFLEALSTKQAQSTRYPRLCLSWVCRQWREIINGFTGIWTVIRFSPWKGEELIWEFVSRSGSAELSVFSPSLLDDSANVHEGSGSRLNRTLYKDIFTTLIELLHREGHRIKFLFFTDDQFYKLPPAVLETVFQAPVLKTFIFKEPNLDKHDFRPPEELAKGDKTLATVINSTKCLENLNISLSVESSLSEIKPSLDRLVILNIRFTSTQLKNRFCVKFLPMCSKLESLAISSTMREWHTHLLPSVITLPNLITLDTDVYSLLHKLRAPALKRLEVLGARRTEFFDQPAYVVFESYDLSSLTHFSIRGVDLLCNSPKILIHGSAGPLVRYKGPSAWFKHTNNQQFDTKGDISVSPSSADPAYFYIWTPVMFPITIGTALLPKISPKLINLEVLYINSLDNFGYTPFNDSESLSLQDISRLRGFFRQIIHNFVSTNLRWLIIGDMETSVKALRSMFTALNGCPLLPSLERVTFGTYSIDGRRVEISVIHDFGEKLVNFLKVRRKAGLEPLLKFEIYSIFSLSETLVAKAAALGTQIVQHPYKSDWFDDLRDGR